MTRVRSLAGTAIQGVRSSEKAGFRGILMDAVHATTRKCFRTSKLANGEEKDVYAC